MSLFNTIKELLLGMGISVIIFFVTLIFSLPLGLVVSFLVRSKNQIISKLTKLYISLMRGTPLMLQLMVVYFGPYFIFGIRISNSYRLWAALIGFVLNYSAYFAEIYRSGIQSIAKGQYEAAQILSYSKTQCFFVIILPQVIKAILPAITNEVITLVKDTSLAFSISVAEMFSVAKALSSSSASMLPFVLAAIFYYIFNLIVSYTMEFIERKMTYYR